MTDAWLVFVRDGARLALPGAGVERVLTAPALVRLPGPGSATPQQRGGRALHVGNELLPLVGGGRAPAMALALLHPAGRFAITVEEVLGFGPLAPDGTWGGQAVTCRSVDAFVPPPQPRAPAAAIGPGGGAVPRSEPAAAPPRWLLLQTGGSAWTVAEAELDAIHGPAPCTPVPFAPPGLVGVAVLRGVAVPVVGPPLRARAGTGQAGYAVLRGQTGAIALPLDADPAWTSRAGAAPRLHPDALREKAALAPAAHEPPAPLPPPRSIRLLPLMVAGRRFAVPVDAVDRVLPAAPLVRLPAGGRAVAVDGRVVPVWDARRWLGLGAPGTAATVHVLLREQGALAVDGVDRTVAIDSARMRPLHDPGRRLRAIAHAPGGSWPVLDLTALGPGRGPTGAAA